MSTANSSKIALGLLKLKMANELLTSGAIRKFMPRNQIAAIKFNLKGEEGEYFAEKVIEYSERIDKMPHTYQQDGLGGEAVAHLHYFRGSIDAYITEKDVDGGVDQAFGLVCLTGNISDAELGYVSITELVNNGLELDLHWEPKTLREIKAG